MICERFIPIPVSKLSQNLIVLRAKELFAERKQTPKLLKVKKNRKNA